MVSPPMAKTLKTKDKTLEVTLFDDGMVEIESNLYEHIGIEIKRVDPSNNIGGPKGALYEIWIYKPEPNAKAKPFEYDIAWVMPDGTIIKRGEQ